MLVLIHADASTLIEDVAFAIYGPFDTMDEAQAYAEDFRERHGLPREATPDNNDAWTDAGHWFGIVPLANGNVDEF